MNAFCGIDFGTSNSTVGVVTDGLPVLVPLEQLQPTLPSALFYNFDEKRTSFGREAIDDYIDGEYGRLMRSLKSLLGTSLMNQATHLGQRNVTYVEIIAEFIGELKRRAELNIDRELTHVVAGRPVNFVDDDVSADSRAQDALAEIYRLVGFKEVEFQFEPIAAALNYEQQLSREELALIVDIGGGTSDFTLIQLSPQRMRSHDRSEDILATTGIHIGGNDFDRRFNMFKAMPMLGMRSAVHGDSSELVMPTKPYFDLSTWHLIHKQYEKKNVFDIQQLKLRAKKPELIARLLKVLDQQDGHRLISSIESCKIHLADHPDGKLDLSFIEDNLQLECLQSELDEATAREVEGISKTINQTLQLAELKPQNVSSIFLTGGTTGLPSVRHAVKAIFPQGNVVEGDKFGSVGAGLTFDAMKRFA